MKHYLLIIALLLAAGCSSDPVQVEVQHVHDHKHSLDLPKWSLPARPQFKTPIRPDQCCQPPRQINIDIHRHRSRPRFQELKFPGEN